MVVAEHWLGSVPVTPPVSRKKETSFFLITVSAPYVREDFLLSLFSLIVAWPIKGEKCVEDLHRKTRWMEGQKELIKRIGYSMKRGSKDRIHWLWHVHDNNNRVLMQYQLDHDASSLVSPKCLWWEAKICHAHVDVRIFIAVDDTVCMKRAVKFMHVSNQIDHSRQQYSHACTKHSCTWTQIFLTGIHQL